MVDQLDGGFCRRLIRGAEVRHSLLIRHLPGCRRTRQTRASEMLVLITTRLDHLLLFGGQLKATRYDGHNASRASVTEHWVVQFDEPHRADQRVSVELVRIQIVCSMGP